MNNIYYCKYSEDILKKTAVYLLNNNKNNFLEILKIIIFVPNNKSKQILSNYILEISGCDSTVLPNIISLGDINCDNLNLLDSDNKIINQQPISKLDLKLHIYQIINEYGNEKNDFNKNLKIVDAICDVILEIDSVDSFNNNILQLFDNEMSLFKENMINYLRLIIAYLPSKLDKYILPEKYRLQVIDLFVDVYSKSNNKIIIIGSTGSLKSTSKLIKFIAKHPQGEVILPYIDMQIEENIWQNILNNHIENHPQYALIYLLDYLQISRKDLTYLTVPKYDIHQFNARHDLLSNINMPIPAISKWNDLNIDQKHIANISYVEADDMLDEAKQITLMLQYYLQDNNKKIAVISNNKQLFQMIISYSKSKNITLDESSLPIKKHRIINIMNNFIELVFDDSSPSLLLNLLKEELVNLGQDKVEYKENINYLDKIILRSDIIYNNLFSLSDLILTKFDNKILSNIINIVAKLTYDFRNNKSIKFSDMLLKHINIIEKLCDVNILWNSEDAKRINEVLFEIYNDSKNIHINDIYEYSIVLRNLLSQYSFTKTNYSQQNILLLSPIEARLHKFDIVIIADLNKDSFPSLNNAHQWLNESFKKKLGFKSDGYRMGQSLYDFYKLCATEQVILTRSLKNLNGLTKASGIIMRLNAFLQKYDLQPLIIDNNWKNWLKIIENINDSKEHKRPQPSPAIELRPKNLSATNIEQLMQNPYSFYARKILNLRILNPLITELSSLNFGNFIHKVIELFLLSHANSTKNKSELLEEMFKIGKKEAIKLGNEDLIISLWWPRFEAISNWLVDQQITRKLKFEIIAVENKGSINIAVENQQYKLYCTADRIEVNNNNELAIIDYKTGALPTVKDIISGFKCQILVEAIIGQNQGFTDFNIIPQNNVHKISQLLLWQLSGVRDIAEELDILSKLKDIDYNEFYNHILIQVHKLISYFNNPHSYYLYKPNYDKGYQDEYDHLARNI